MGLEQRFRSREILQLDRGFVAERLPKESERVVFLGRVSSCRFDQGMLNKLHIVLHDRIAPQLIFPIEGKIAFVFQDKTQAERTISAEVRKQKTGCDLELEVGEIVFVEVLDGNERASLAKAMSDDLDRDVR
jgi:hypothetical protein